MTATGTAQAIGDAASQAISTSITTGLDFLTTTDLIVAFVIGAIAFIFIAKLMGFLHLR